MKNNMQFIGQSTKKIYQLGDDVKIQVKKADLERKHLDFNLIETLKRFYFC